MASRSWGREGLWGNCLTGMEFSYGVMTFLKIDRGDGHTNCEYTKGY